MTVSGIGPPHGRASPAGGFSQPPQGKPEPALVSHPGCRAQRATTRNRPPFSDESATDVLLAGRNEPCVQLDGHAPGRVFVGRPSALLSCTLPGKCWLRRHPSRVSTVWRVPAWAGTRWARGPGLPQRGHDKPDATRPELLVPSGAGTTGLPGQAGQSPQASRAEAGSRHGAAETPWPTPRVFASGLGADGQPGQAVAGLLLGLGAGVVAWWLLRRGGGAESAEYQ